MSTTSKLSRLERVGLRTAWPNEAINFTPWLAEKPNLDLLAEKLGIPLQLEAMEKEVGTFSADILAKEPDTERWVLIENQITPTDHSHLGQLITYAAGLEAKTIIWIAEDFREEHRAAIDFLNRATTEEFAFFGVQIELYKIGDSPFAPNFSVVAKPNDWSKRTQSARQASDETEIQRRWKEYWAGLIGAAKGRYPAVAEREPYRTNWQTFETIKGGNPSFTLNAVFPWDKGLRLEVYVDRSRAKLGYEALHRQKDQIEQVLGKSLSWEELPTQQASKIALVMPGDQKRENEGAWKQQQEWLLTWGPKLVAALRPFIVDLKIFEKQ
jgi:Domain of unknown function (DUF4268)